MAEKPPTYKQLATDLNKAVRDFFDAQNKGVVNSNRDYDDRLGVLLRVSDDTARQLARKETH